MLGNSILPTPPAMEGVTTLEKLNFFCNRSLPAVYTDELSYYEVLCKMASVLNDALEDVNVLSGNVEALAGYVEELYNLLSDFEQEGIGKYYQELVEKWIGENLEYVFESVAKQVFFGLTSTGYFCAYVPSSWSDITFDTGAVYGSEYYGRLMLRYSVDGGTGVIDNDYETQNLQELVQGVLRASVGNGIKYNSVDDTIYVPIGGNLRYTSDGIDAPEADSVNFGVVKIAHEISNESTDGVAASPDAVYAFAQPRS